MREQSQQCISEICQILLNIIEICKKERYDIRGKTFRNPFLFRYRFLILFNRFLSTNGVGFFLKAFDQSGIFYLFLQKRVIWGMMNGKCFKETAFCVSDFEWNPFLTR